MSQLWARALGASVCLLALAAPASAAESGSTSGIDQTLLLVIVPLVVIQLVLVVWALYDLTRPGRRVKGDSKVLWAIAIVFLNIVGPLAYFFFGREDA